MSRNGKTSIALLVLLLVVFSLTRFSWLRQRWYDVTTPSLPAAEPARNTTARSGASITENISTITTSIPAEKNLAVPFTTQAPNANWDADHEEFCEEAAVAMAGRFFAHTSFKNSADQETALQAVKTWEVQHFGFYFDTTGSETAEMLRGVYGLTVTLKTNPTIDDLKGALAAGELVIVPTAGRELGNPNFKSPGPIYHNLVLRGYTQDGHFITNDPGTRKGEAYVYAASVIMSAMHDWVPNGIRTVARQGDATGQKVVLIVSS